MGVLVLQMPQKRGCPPVAGGFWASGDLQTGYGWTPWGPANGAGRCTDDVRMALEGGTDGALLQSDDTDDQRHGMDGSVRQFKGVVLLVVRHDEYMAFVASRLYALDERPLVGVYHVDLVPLEEEVGHGHTLARHYIAGAVLGVHARPLYGYEEVCALECRHHIAFALIFQYGFLVCQGSCHGVNGDEGDAAFFIS